MIDDWYTDEIPEPECGIVQKTVHPNPDTRAHYIITNEDVYYIKDGHIEPLSCRQRPESIMPEVKSIYDDALAMPGVSQGRVQVYETTPMQLEEMAEAVLAEMQQTPKS